MLRGSANTWQRDSHHNVQSPLRAQNVAPQNVNTAAAKSWTNATLETQTNTKLLCLTHRSNVSWPYVPTSALRNVTEEGIVFAIWQGKTFSFPQQYSYRLCSQLSHLINGHHRSLPRGQNGRGVILIDNIHVNRQLAESYKRYGRHFMAIKTWKDTCNNWHA